MILGFIGTGKISSSIIFGIFKSKLKIKRIYISSRNRNIAKKLSKSYGKIKVLNNNQQIIDKSSVVLLGVTPNVGNKILPKLKFSKNKRIIRIDDKTNLGIFTFNPIKAARAVINIGPKNQASGTLK